MDYSKFILKATEKLNTANIKAMLSPKGRRLV